MSIGIVNYGMGNLTSVKNAVSFLGYTCEVVDKQTDISRFEKLILPGVGAFGKAMENLKTNNWLDELMENVLIKKKPILGICLGMQLFYNESEEFGIHEGIGIINGTVKSFKEVGFTLPVPQVGWNIVKKVNDSKLLKGIDDDALTFYFVNSFYCSSVNDTDVTGKTEYGVLIDSVIERENIFGCQFHPEKSQKVGLKLIENFCSL